MDKSIEFLANLIFIPFFVLEEILFLYVFKVTVGTYF